MPYICIRPVQDSFLLIQVLHSWKQTQLEQTSCIINKLLICLLRFYLFIVYDLGIVFNMGKCRVANCAIKKDFTGVWTRRLSASQIAETQLSVWFLKMTKGFFRAFIQMVITTPSMYIFRLQVRHTNTFNFSSTQQGTVDLAS